MRIACVLLALMSTAIYGAEVYRSTDANGTIVYSDRPQGSEPQLVVVVATPRSAASQQQPPISRETARTPAAPAADAPAAATPAAQSPQERAQARAKNCSTARERLQSYTVSHRLYRSTENGEREYLNNDEIDEARARAAADVETWCD